MPLRTKLDLNLLRVAVALLDAGSASQAARQLGLSQPSVSESLAKLRTWGVYVLNGELGQPGQNDRFRGQFPWRRALQAVSRPVASRVEPGALS